MSRHVVDAMATGRTSRADIVKRGLKLEYFTIAYNSLEGLIAIVAGLFAGSIALIGFGFDSVIEVTSGGMLLWRLYADVNESLRERAERHIVAVLGHSVRGFSERSGERLSCITGAMRMASPPR